VTPLKFTVSNSFYKPNIKIGFFSSDHGDRELFDGVLGTLAHAFSPPNGQFHLDAAETWVTSDDVLRNFLLTKKVTEKKVLINFLVVQSKCLVKETRWKKERERERREIGREMVK
jgi:hypothetical protein